MPSRIPCFELALTDTKASRIRLVDALIWRSGRRDRVQGKRSLLSAHIVCGCISCLVRCPVADIGEVREALAKSLIRCDYRSPDYLDNGSLRPIYASPEDEEADRQRPEYDAWLVRQKERELKGYP